MLKQKARRNLKRSSWRTMTGVKALLQRYGFFLFSAFKQPNGTNSYFLVSSLVEQIPTHLECIWSWIYFTSISTQPPSLTTDASHFQPHAVPLHSTAYFTPSQTSYVCKYFSSFTVRIKLRRTADFTLSNAYIFIFTNPGMYIITHGNHFYPKHCPKWTAAQ